MRSQFYTTLLLAIAIQLDYFILHADAEDLQKPEIGVQSSGGQVDLVCLTKLEHLPSGNNVTCNLYIGDSSEPFRSTWTKKKVCSFVVKRDDLKQGLQSVGATEVSCDYSVPTDPRSPSPRSYKRKIEGLSPGTSTFSEAGKLPKAELKLSPAVISIEESVNLRCSRPDSAPASHCTFTINQRREISGSDCERSVTGVELLSRSHRARNEIIMRCFYRLEEGGKPARHSDPSTMTVLDLRKPKISVSTEHTETHIRCEAPPDITGAIFFLYYNRSSTPTKETQAGTEERAVSFTVPRSSDSTLTYCCSYQFEGFNSKLSDCAEAKNKDQSGRTNNQNKTATSRPAVTTNKTSTAHSTTTFNTTASLQSTSAARSAVTAASRTSHHSSGKVTSQPPQTPAQQTAEPPTVPPIEPPTEPRTVPTTELRTVSTTELRTVSTTELRTVSTTEQRTVSTTEQRTVSTTEQLTVSTTEQRTVSTTEQLTVSTTEGISHVILPVGIGSVVGVAVLGMTAVCLCKRYKRQKSKRRTEHINSSLYASVTMENMLSASNTGDIDGIYTEINNVPSTFKSPPVPSQNDTYSLITAVPASSKLPLPDASVEMENILSASNTGGTDGIYTEINNVPSTFKSPPVPSQNDTYSLIPAVPASSKLPLPAQDDAHTAHHSATYSTLQMH